MEYLKKENCRSVSLLTYIDVLCECSQRIFMRKKGKRKPFITAQATHGIYIGLLDV